MRILDIGIVGNTVFTTDLREVVGWDLEVGEIVHRAFCMAVVESEATAVGPDGRHSTLTTGYSWVTFTIHGIIFLYGFRDQLVHYKRTVDRDVMDIQFTPDGRQLCFIPHMDLVEAMCAESWMAEQSVDLPEEFTEDVGSPDDQASFSVHGYRILRGSGWIEGHGDRKLLWLPPNWRVTYSWKAGRKGNFLVLTDGRLPVPITIAFQPQSLLPPSHSIQPSDT